MPGKMNTWQIARHHCDRVKAGLGRSSAVARCEMLFAALDCEASCGISLVISGRSAGL